LPRLAQAHARPTMAVEVHKTPRKKKGIGDSKQRNHIKKEGPANKPVKLPHDRLHGSRWPWTRGRNMTRSRWSRAIWVSLGTHPGLSAQLGLTKKKRGGHAKPKRRGSVTKGLPQRTAEETLLGTLRFIRHKPAEMHREIRGELISVPDTQFSSHTEVPWQ